MRNTGLMNRRKGIDHDEGDLLRFYLSIFFADAGCPVYLCGTEESDLPQEDSTADGQTAGLVRQ
jgi:hypothetical protein